MLSDYTKNKLLKRLFAKEYEVVCFYCSSFYGNMGEYDKSNELSVNGIADEIECERAYAMTSFYIIYYGITAKLALSRKVI